MVDIHSNDEEKDISIVTNINLLDSSEESCNELNECLAEVSYLFI